MNSVVTARRPTAANGSLVTLTPTVSSATILIVREEAIPAPKTKASKKAEGKKIDAAVFAYIQALRALGRDTVNTLEIATGLGLSVKAVDEAAKRLAGKGVRLA